MALASSSSGGAADVAEEAALTVKYLSSPKLMGLQLQDAALRRHFLLQALVFLHACQNPLLKPGTAAAQQAKKEALRSKQVRSTRSCRKSRSSGSLWITRELPFRGANPPSV